MKDSKQKSKTHMDRREEIILAALETFSEKGIVHTRIEEVALAAGIGKGTIYEYFRSKEELIYAAVRYEMEELAVLVKSRMDQETSVRDKLIAIVETTLHHHRQYKRNPIDLSSTAALASGIQTLKPLYLEQNALWLTWLEEIIKNGVASGEIRQVDPQILLGALMGAVMHILRPWSGPDWSSSVTPGEAAAQITELFYEGIKKN